MTEPGRATVFGRDAAAYERARPGYPDQAIEHMLDLVRPTRVVEVGAGTGKATASVAQNGLELICLEPSAEMAELLEVRGLPGVTVVRQTFEAWEPDIADFDLVYAAQAWHWVDPGVGLAKTRRILRPGGVLSLVWNLPRRRYDDFADVYALHAPQILHEQDERITRRDRHDWLADMEVAGFVDLDRFSHDWTVEMTASEIRELYSTYSDHIMLPDVTRHALLEGLEEAVEERGGTVVQEYTTEVFSGRN
jgi:SAM-dependent methyltransferase